MGSHRNTSLQVSVLGRRRVSGRHPALPDNVGRRTKWKSIRGELREVTIVGEIRRIQSNNPHKVICLQQLRFDHTGEVEFRLGYYMIGVKPRMRGRWTWGQFAVLIPARDFTWIIRQAQRLGWI